MNKQKIAVFFGGPAVEHDISILTGLQIIEAMDSTKYMPIPIYIDQKGQWWHGRELLDRRNYHFTKKIKDKLEQVELCIGTPFTDKPFLVIKNGCLFKKSKKIFFDLAFLTFHGEIGEDGNFQGLLEATKIPYTGTRTLAAAIYMNKLVAKNLFRNAGIPVLQEIVIKKPTSSIIDVSTLTKDLVLKFPLCAKPCNLGSSVGIHIVQDLKELHAAILAIFKIDQSLLLEPFVENLVEYNIAVTKALGDEVVLSAIEKPIKKDAVYSFKDKYLSQGGIANKLTSSISEGLVAATRELNPTDLTEDQKNLILKNAKLAFEIVNSCGAPRMDFLCNSKTGEIWLNEVNPLPGSIGYFLWEACTPKISFTTLIDGLIQEGFLEKNKSYKTFNLQDLNCSMFPVRYS